MTTRTLFAVAFRAARVAAHTDEAGFRSPLAAGLDATREHMDAPGRFPVVAAAARVAEMSRSFRLRTSMRVVLRPATGLRLMGLRAREVR